MAVNWAKFLDLDGHPWENFEVLCYELVRRHYGSLGLLTYARGEAGVEFHLLLDADCELGTGGQRIGWQCKWFETAKLTGSRRRQISNSFSKAKRTFPTDLTRWMLWTRDALSPVDSDWVEALDGTIKTESWHSANVDGLMAGDAYVLRQSFFGDLVLTADWFHRRYDEALAPVRGKYDPALHVAVEQEEVVHRLLGDPTARGELGMWQGDLASYPARLLQAEANLGRVRGQLVPEGQGHLDALAAATRDLRNKVELTERELGVIYDELEHGDFATAAVVASGITEMRWDERPFREALLLVDDVLPDDPGDESASRSTRPRLLEEAVDQVWEPTDPHATIIVEVQDLGRRLETSLLVVIAEAGRGKTHFAAQVAGGFGDHGKLGILLHGREFTAALNEHDLATAAGLPGKSLEEFLEAVNAVGLRTKRRVPIVIDALNESPEPKRWKDVLARINVAAARFGNVVIVVTLRPSYEQWAVPDDVDSVALYGFSESLEAAVNRYFDHYKIEADRTIETLAQFEHPLFLSIYCQATNPRRRDFVSVELGVQTRYEVFERYVEAVELDVADRLGLDPTERVVTRTLTAIAAELWVTRARDLSFERAKEIAGDRKRAWQDTVTRALEDEGVILRDAPRFGGAEEERVAFAYDLFAGWLVAARLIDDHSDDGVAVATDEVVVRRLTSDDDSVRHPLADDIMVSLSGLLPRRTGVNLWKAATDPTLTYWGTLDLFLLEGRHVDSESVEQIERLFIELQEHPRQLANMLRLFRTTRSYSTHPLNAKFQSSLLRRLDVWERDLIWTEWVRNTERVVKADVDRLERRWRTSSTPLTERDELIAEWLSWVLTTTDRPLRDEVTRALYWFGRRRPDALFAISSNAIGINDIYVAERLLAAAYGVAMARWVDADPEFIAVLIAYAERLRALLLTPDATQPTTHYLARDYASKTCDLAARLTRAPMAGIVASDLQPPFRHPRMHWDEIQKNDERYEDADWAIHMDFENYTVGGLVGGRANYDMEHLDYRTILGRIRWRVHDLGYRQERFGDVDSQIAERQWRRDQQPGRTERYGKKYSWIGFFEMAGELLDQGRLDLDNWHRPRLPDADIDPSFPESAPPLELALPTWIRPTPKDPRAWLRRGLVSVPNDLLAPESVNGVGGHWVAVEGFLISDGRPTSDREVFAFVRGILVEPTQWSQLRQRLEEVAYPGNSLIPDVGSDYYTYAGEVPWSPTFAPDFLSETGESLPHVDEVDFGDGPSYPIELLGHTYQWESHHSVTNQAGGALVPARAFSSFHALRGRPQTFDLHRPDGSKAAMCVAAPSGIDRGHMLYLREDLLREYAASRGLEIAWIVWGERRIIREWSGPRDDAFARIYQAYTHIHRRVVSLEELRGAETARG